MHFIDAHSHIWTPDTAHYPLAAGFRRFDMKPPSFTAEELIKQMTPVGVDRAVLIQMSFYGFDNSYMLDSIKRYPKHFVGVAIIDQDNPKSGETMKKLKPQGVRGFRIWPKNQPVERWLENDGLRTMFKVGAEENLPMCCLIDPDALPSLEKACTKFPETPVVIDHICRIGIGNKINPAEVDALCHLAKHKHVTVKISAFYALGKALPPYADLAPLIKRVYEAYGPERLMWATDCPYQVVDHTYKQSIDLIQSHLDFLKDSDKEWLLRKTAERVFFHN